MEVNDPIIDAIKTKILNTLRYKEADANISGSMDPENIEEIKFRSYYFSHKELLTEIQLIEDTNKRNNLVAWIKEKRLKDPIIKEALQEI